GVDSARGGLYLWPRVFTLESYRFVFAQGKIFSPMRVTAAITLAGTAINLFMTAFMSYGMSKPYPGNKLVSYMVVLTMFVSAGLIPNYMLFRKLRLLNNVWVYILPSMINTFYLIILRTNFAGFSREVEEAAIIDGCGDYGAFFRIVLPLSKPILAAIALFTAVDYWNTYAASVYYVTDAGKKTLQDYLYMLLSDSATNAGGMGATAIGSTAGRSAVFSENIKLANTMIAILPILLVYPFLQRYFTSGMMVGAIKG
ncbi:MAG TPA: carbohydrate ABC transporter permease, partial [Clostridia bacterium]|nr:carbohydrate ABC transporter permease [Clostridia bacterium]